MIHDPADLIYCDGWDPWSRVATGPLPVEVARERDLAGERYAVLLLDGPGDGADPVAMLEISWRSLGCTVWHFDHQRRRVAKHELRRLCDDELVLCEWMEWRYQDPLRPEFDATAGRHTRRCSVEGLLHDVNEPDGDRGDSWHRFGTVPGGAPRHPVPAFGDLAALAGLARAVAAPPPVTVPGSGGPGLAMSKLVPVPWQPPVPLRPGPLSAMFRHGTRCHLPDQGEVVVEVRPAGALRMPSGRLVAVDVDAMAGGIPFTVGVPPGTYPVELSLLRPVGAPHRASVAAGRLLTSPDPVTSWELALRSCREPRMLASWDFFGFETTTGAACLVDAAARPLLARTAAPHQFIPARAGQVVELAEPDGGNLIAFPAGVGAYPTWIGRTADGRVACFVTDLLRLHDARMLS
jgi:hypothetical protein